MFRWFWIESDLPFLYILSTSYLGTTGSCAVLRCGDRRQIAWHNELSNSFIIHRAEKALRECLLCLTLPHPSHCPDMVYLSFSLENIILILKNRDVNTDLISSIAKFFTTHHEANETF